MNRNLTAEIFFKTIIIDGYRGRYFTLEIPQGHAVFLMDSNTGKTTVIELLRWCLTYPTSKAEGKYQHMWHNNAHVLDNEIDGEQECKIIIEFESEGIRYKLERKTKGIHNSAEALKRGKNGDHIININDTLEINNGEQILQDDDAFNYLLLHFKIVQSARYCFFDGEKARETIIMAQYDTKRLITEIEQRATDLKLKNFLDQVSFVKKLLMNTATQTLTSRAETIAQNKITKIKEDNDKLNIDIINKEIEILALEDNITQLDNIIQNLTQEITHRKSQALIQRTNLNNQLNLIKGEAVNLRNEIYSNHFDWYNLKSYDILSDIKLKLREKGKVPEPFREQLIHNCLNSIPPKCQICGRKLDDDQSKNYVLNLEKQIASNEIQDFLYHKKFKGEESSFDALGKRHEIILKLNNFRDLKTQIQSIDISEEDENAIIDLSRKRREKDSIVALKGQWLEQLAQLKKKLEENEEALESELERIDYIKERMPLLEELENTLKILENTKKIMRNRTIEIVGNVISKAVSNIIGDNFKAYFTAEDGLMLGHGDRASPEIGGYGGNLILSYLFAEAMSSVNTMIIDTPVGNVGTQRRALGNHLAANHSQVILFCLQNELADFSDCFVDEVIEIRNQERDYN